jgi:hypothetical protein
MNPLLRAGTASNQEFPWFDTFTGSDGAAWDTAKWTADSTLLTPAPDIQSNKGRMQFVTTGVSRAIALHTAIADIDVTGTVDLPASFSAVFSVMIRCDGTWQAGDPPACTNGIRFILHQASGNLYSDEFNPGYTSRPSATLDTSAGGTWNWRAQAIGSTAKFNVWQGSEPAWPISFTATRSAAGVLQLSQQNAGTISVDNVTVVKP